VIWRDIDSGPLQVIVDDHTQCRRLYPMCRGSISLVETILLEVRYLYRWPCHRRDTAASVRIVCLSIDRYSELGPVHFEEKFMKKWQFTSTALLGILLLSGSPAMSQGNSQGHGAQMRCTNSRDERGHQQRGNPEADSNTGIQPQQPDLDNDHGPA
jgi:hypothetical protein